MLLYAANARRNTSPGLFTFYYLRVTVNNIINRSAYIVWPHWDNNSNAVNSNTEKRLLFYWQVDKVDVKLERKIQLKDLNYMRREMY